MKPDARTGYPVPAAMHRFKTAVRGSAAALGLTALACSDSPQIVTIEVYSWWKARSEQLALDVVSQEHERAHPNVDIITREADLSSDLRRQLTGELMAGVPPATFQANVGADLLQWAVLDRGMDPVHGIPQPEKPRIAGLSNEIRDRSLWTDLPPRLWEALLVGGEPYAVPINIHQVNRIYYNEEKVRDYSETHGKDLLDIDTLCPEDRAGELGVPIAIGYDQGFPLVILTFENVLVARTSAQFYEDLFRGRRPSGWQQAVRDALECVQYLSRSFLRPHQETGSDDGKVDSEAYKGWVEALAAVADKAAFTVMGDWASGERKNHETSLVKDRPFPGTEEVFVFASDTFPLPAGTAHRDEAAALLETIASKDVQRKFSVVKGSKPARDSAAFEDDTPVLATSGLLPHFYPLSELQDLLGRMVAPGAGDAEVAAALRLFIDSEPLLGLWQERLEREKAAR